MQKKIWFWVLQVLGWGIPIGINSFAKLFSLSQLSRLYIIAEGVSFFIYGIAMSLVLRWIIKREELLKHFKRRSVLKVLLAHILLALIGTFLLEQTAKLAYLAFENEPLVRAINSYAITLANIYLYLFFWMALYMAIKLAAKSQSDKISKAKLEVRLKDAHLNTLKGQINPHFMFNSLNNIRGLILEDVHKSREMITKLSELLRYSLNYNKEDFISIREELQMVRNYIDLSKIQLEDRLSYSENIDKLSLDLKIPPMFIQMLVENAIKHGIAKQISGGEIELGIKLINSVVSIKVKNSGILYPTTSSTEIGVKNIKDRLRLIYEDKANFALKQIGNYVVATIEIDLSKQQQVR